MLFRRSLLQELISTSTGAFLVLLGIVFAQRCGNFIRLAAKGALPNDAITTLLGFNMIMYLPMLLSLSLFLTILMTLSRCYRDSEMVIWFTSGLSINSWIRPVLTFTVPTVIIITVLSLFITPWSRHKIDDYLLQLKSRDELSTLTPGVFKESSNTDRVFFVESFDELGNIVKNIFVQSVQHQKLGIIVASQGNRVIEKNGDNFLVMHHGRRYQGTRGTAEYSTTEFEKYAVRVEANEAQQDPPSIQSKSTQELIQNYDSSNIAEIQSRLSIPLSALILALLAIPLSALDPRAGRSANFVLAIVIYILYNNFLSIFQSWVIRGKINGFIGLWPVHLLFAGIAFYMFYRRAQHLPILPSLSLPSWAKFNNNNKV